MRWLNIIIDKKGESKSNNGMKVEERSVVPCFRLIVSDAGRCDTIGVVDVNNC